MATVDPGDEVIIPVPSWIAYTQMTELCEGVPVLVSCPQNNGFKPRAEDIDAAVTPRTKWLILNNPNNPTGACCSAAGDCRNRRGDAQAPACLGAVGRHV